MKGSASSKRRWVRISEDQAAARKAGLADWLTPVHLYLAALDAGEFDEAAGWFSDDALYVRPAMPRLEVVPALDALRGRSAIRSYFSARGKMSFHHEVTNHLYNGETCFVQGVVRDRDPSWTDVFMCSAKCSSGLITKYVAVSNVLAFETAATLIEIEENRR